jgi:creatinine amidohydrolase
MPRGAWLEDLTWPEAKARLDAGAVVVVPIGAIAKEHGHHLPLKTDFLVARELACRIAEALPVLVAPVICFGYYPAFTRYPGSQHLRAETFIALVGEIVEKLIADGARRIAIVNTGVSTEAPLRILARDLLERAQVRVAVADIGRLGMELRRREGRQALGGHGDEWETSAILAIAPELVRFERAVADYGAMLGRAETVFWEPTCFTGNEGDGIDFSLTGIRGDPTLATAEKGRALLAEMARELIAGICAIHPEAAA